VDGQSIERDQCSSLIEVVPGFLQSQVATTPTNGAWSNDVIRGIWVPPCRKVCVSHVIDSALTCRNSEAAVIAAIAIAAACAMGRTDYNKSA